MTESKKQLNFRVVIILVFILISSGCITTESTPNRKEISPIRPGMDYEQAKDILASVGLEEEKSAMWSIKPPENINVFTYFLCDNKYLLVSVSEATGEIESLDILEPSPLGKMYHKTYDLKSFPEK